MRSRPLAKLYYAAKSAQGGERFEVELVLESKTRTPTDFTKVRLVGTERVVTGEGKQAFTSHYDIVRLEVTEPPRVLTPGQLRRRYQFDLPAGAPPSFFGVRCVVQYAFTVHVSVPWWPDRRASFVLPVIVPGPRELGGTPRIVASSDGPRVGQIYAEVSIDRDVVEPGGVISGAVSVANTGAHRIRRVTTSLVATEDIFLHGAQRVQRHGVAFGPYAYQAQRFGITVAEGSPPETFPIPFAIRVPPQIMASLSASSFRWTWHLETRVVVAFSDDVVVNIPLSIDRPPAGTRPRAPGQYFLVGRDRFARVWQEVALRVGMSLDPDGVTLRATAGVASLALRRVYDGNAYRLRLDFAWPALGLDLHVTERAWSMVDVIVSHWTSEVPRANERFLMQAREHAQLALVLRSQLLAALVDYSNVSVTDSGAQLSIDIAGTSGAALEGWCRSALALLRGWDEIARSVPPPRLMQSAVAPWRAFAQAMSGTLEIGSMSLRNASVGVDRFSVETHWTDATHVEFTEVVFGLDPLLEREVDIADPSLSAAAREMLTSLRAEFPTLSIDRACIAWRVAGAVADPNVLLPAIERTAALVRALRGRPQSGPFR